ncbi:putative carbon-nitrogen family hydrolase putative [Coccomyxa subellipsoidea C-169]|uniref:Carbon-nitrogen family hydrolase putative n=1 Tax=Coccomyxa subellipsoidea (strain C-169) TaxID=574566 RepID=I0YLL7_COCSC|nr:putative carbon-nitrogen family hydrolase putative [Coccomyxa subellipsoidea C-169]EIE19286.1 putative carbon-nitrogen family hydrolase putative [Coccomyxa subellipsoidea C-169]|eukprot:XP_005643830.1 putative carbon-nitrogen family hydrolase putative [Coccomyxa subellipsoidea C-169]
MPGKREVTVACTQISCSWDKGDNLAKAERLVREAAGAGANIILLQELFETPYFCQDQKQELFELARPFEGNPVLRRFADLAKELQVALPISYFERANNSFFNSLAVFDADGTCAGRYRKSHIPDGCGYQEKFYFNPGDTGFQTFQTRFAKIGVAICWDQWFPEAARCMALMGAEVLFYPTAIGSEPQDPSLNSYPHWTRVMCGHAGANLVPLVASNRIGEEKAESGSITFYGGSFIAGPTGEIKAQIGKKTEGELIDLTPDRKEGFAVATFDLEAIRWQRASWGLFRDRRPDLYGPILTLDGSSGKRSGAI